MTIWIHACGLTPKKVNQVKTGFTDAAMWVKAQISLLCANENQARCINKMEQKEHPEQRNPVR